MEQPQSSSAQQITPTNELVPLANHVSIGRCNNKTTLLNIPCLKECRIARQILTDHKRNAIISFHMLITDVPAIYIKQFWKTVKQVPNSNNRIRFMLEKGHHLHSGYVSCCSQTSNLNVLEQHSFPTTGIMKEVNEALREIVPKLTTSTTNDRMKDNLPKMVNDDVKKERERRKYEKSSCKYDAFRKRYHDDHPGDDAPQEVEKSAKRQKTSRSSKSTRGSSSKQPAKNQLNRHLRQP
ncbi:hypothetical protein Tco_0134263 [Tanacetum coccineum]